MYNRLRSSYNSLISSLAPRYEDFQPVTETKENPESILLMIHLPGFKRHQVGTKYEYSNGRIRVFGERLLGVDIKYSGFNQAYPLPENCDASRLQSKFEEETLTIVMPKKVVSKVPPEEEPKPTQQETADTPSKSTQVTPAKPAVDQTKPEKAPEPIPPKSTTPKLEEPKPVVKAQKDHESASREAETTTDKQKQQSTFAQPKPEEFTATPVVEEPKPTIEAQKDHGSVSGEAETITDKQKQQPTIAQPMPEKTQEVLPPKSSVGGSFDQKKSNGERKESSSVAAAESSAMRKLKGVEEEKKKKISGKVDTVAGGKGRENGIEPKGKRIQEVTTRMKEKLRDEDKQMLIYVGAGAAVIVAAAIGAYAYKFLSLPR